MDVRSAFHRLSIAKGDEWKTAFRTRFGAYEWLVTPFGLAGAPAAFQRWINQVLGNLLGVTCAAYLDDILIFSRGTLEDQWSKMHEILNRLFKAGLKLDPNKCEFASKETKYLGFIIKVGEGIKVDPEKVEAIASWDIPKDIKGVRSFLGFANFYRNFIINFATLAGPLQELKKKNATFRWSVDHQNTFNSLKRLFINAPILAMWQENRPTVLETDASGWATGGCLFQYNETGHLNPIAYFSKKLSPIECNYDIHDKELLAIIRCLEELRGELMGLESPFVTLTDHKNLQYFMTSKKLVERQIRWSQFLSEFKFKLKFRAGKHGPVPDALSRKTQDVPIEKDDPRLKERNFKLDKDDWLLSLEQNDAIDVSHFTMLPEKKIPEGNDIFINSSLQKLWIK